MTAAPELSRTRWRFAIALLIFCISLAQITCEGPEGPAGSDGTSDQQIRFSFPSGGLATSDTVGTLCYPSQYLTRFNKANYVDIDSIVFSANMGSSNSSVTCIVELFNVTDSVVVAGSSLVTNASGSLFSWPWIYSGNLINGLPEKEITLAYRIRSGQQGVAVQVNTAVLLAYRR